MDAERWWYDEKDGRVKDENALAVAIVVPAISRTPEHAEERKARDRAGVLLAAAPELLEALREMLAEVPYVGLPGYPPDCECGDFVDYVPLHDEAPSCRHTRARALLARASP